mmetsp:Transcript_21229/g.58993  ORF Transcript_21229/g.58993 Transcript_21229/m.58993 type:complete len:1163 (-) Transcript_21229:57-3545(-)
MRSTAGLSRPLPLQRPPLPISQALDPGGLAALGSFPPRPGAIFGVEQHGRQPTVRRRARRKEDAEGVAPDLSGVDLKAEVLKEFVLGPRKPLWPEDPEAVYFGAGDWEEENHADLEDLLLDEEDEDSDEYLDEDGDEEGEDEEADAVRELADAVVGGPLTIDDITESGLDKENPLQQLGRLFPFKFDKFQKQSVAEMLEGKSVVVCAPTGAGKTCIAEAVAAAVLSKGQRVIYTTPLKALSNQKLLEMRERFSEERTGLQTGDVSLNPDGDIVVMTTEILRNIMYRSLEEREGSGVSQLDDVGLVVLDEVHYLGDPNRGSVWEEVIINCPSHIQMLCMSATVKNPQDLGGWIETVHGPCTTVVTKFRPIPLDWVFASKLDGKTSSVVPLLDGKGKNLSREISKAVKDTEQRLGWKSQRGSSRGSTGRKKLQLGALSIQDALAQLHNRDMLPAIFFIFSRRDCDKAVNAVCDNNSLSLINDTQRAAIRELLDELRASQPEAVRADAVTGLLRGVAAHHAGLLPSWKKLVEAAFQRGLLKAVFATETLAAGINMPARSAVITVLSRRRDGSHMLLTHNELLQMAGRAGRRGYDEEGNVVVMQSRWDGAHEALEVIRRGPEPLVSQFSTSYSMVLSLLATKSLEEAKAFVERSFGNYQSGAGRNKRMEEITDLVTQAEEALKRALSLSERLSASSASKNVNHDAMSRKQKEASSLKRKIQKLRKHARLRRGNLADEKVAKLGSLPVLLALDLPDEGDYGWTQEIHNDEYEPELAMALAVQRLTRDQVSAMGMAKAANDGLPVYVCLGADNRFHFVSSHYIAAFEGQEDYKAIIPSSLDLSSLSPFGRHKPGKPNNGDYLSLAGEPATAALAASIPSAHHCDLISIFSTGEFTMDADDPIVLATRDVNEELRKVRKDLKSLKSQQATASKKQQQSLATETIQEKILAEEQLAEKLMQKATRLKNRNEGQKSSGWISFEQMVDILVKFDALTPELQPTSLGEVAKALRSENELWLAACVTHPTVQLMEPGPLAGLLAALVAHDTMGSRPDQHIAYPPSTGVIAAVEELEEVCVRLSDLQMEASTIACEITIDLRFSGLVEAWVSGMSWAQLTKDTSLDEGDIARLLGRTSDVLRQLIHIPMLLPDIKATARQAVKGMVRTPISDLVT